MRNICVETLFKDYFSFGVYFVRRSGISWAIEVNGLIGYFLVNGPAV